MTTYARVRGGVVLEIFTPPTGVTVAMCFPASIAMQFIAVPDGVSVQQDWTYDGTNWAAPVAPPPPPPPTLQQQALAAMFGTITIACISVPALNATYPIDQLTQAQITGIAAATSASLGLPGGGSTFNWPDVTGTPHQWGASQFSGLAKAVMNYVYACAQVAQGNGSTLPSSTVTIA